MTVHVDVIKEEHYTYTLNVPEEKEDEIYEKLSCESCMDDEFDVEMFLEENNIPFEKYEDGNENRVETWK